MARRRVVAGGRSAGRSATPGGVRGRKGPLPKLWLGLGGTAGLLAIIVVVVAVFARPIESSWDDAKLSGPALLVEDVRRVAANGPDGWVWYFPQRLSDEQVKALAAEVRARQRAELQRAQPNRSGPHQRHAGEGGRAQTTADRRHPDLDPEPGRRGQRQGRRRPRRPGQPRLHAPAHHRRTGEGLAVPRRAQPLRRDRRTLPFEVAATTTSCWCTWEIEVDVTSGDQKETMRISEDASGAPLQTIYSGADLHYDSEYQISLVNGEFINCALVAAGDPAEIARAAGGVYCKS